MVRNNFQSSADLDKFFALNMFKGVQTSHHSWWNYLHQYNPFRLIENLSN